ncbi:hypothetical protein Tco_1341168, partial [Tanacetum coccineum]
APPSSDYVPGPKKPEQALPSPDFIPEQAPPSPDFIPEHAYLEFMPLEDDVFLAEEQPLPAAVSPTTDSPGYISESNPKEEPKEDDEDPEEDLANYPADGGDDGDDEGESSDDDEGESSDDDEDDDIDIEGDEEEEEHLDFADSTAVALPAVDETPSAKETEPFETDESAATPPPHPAYRITARISIRP